MTFITNTENRICFIACEDSKAGLPCKCTNQMSDIYLDYQNALKEESDRELENTNKILIEISDYTDDDYLKCIKEWLEDEENGIWGNLKIVDKPIGEWQNEKNEFEESYWDILKGMYVNQSCGWTGDDYSGTLEIKLPNGKYLRASFSL